MHPMPQPIGVGLAGSGFMGRAHALGLRMVGGVRPDAATRAAGAGG